MVRELCPQGEKWACSSWRAYPLLLQSTEYEQQMFIFFHTPLFSISSHEKLCTNGNSGAQKICTHSQFALVWEKTVYLLKIIALYMRLLCKFVFECCFPGRKDGAITYFCRWVTNCAAAGTGILRVRRIPWPWFSSHLDWGKPNVSLINSIFSDVAYCYSNVRTRPLCAPMLTNYSASAVWLRQQAKVRSRSLTLAQMKNTALADKVHLSPTHAHVCK